MRSIALLVIMFLTTLGSKSQTSLYPGDLSIIAVNADGEKSFAVLFLRDVSAGTSLNFTDNAWIAASNSFRDSEGVLTFTAPSDIAKGQVVVCPSKDGGNGFVESGSFNPAGSGDNIIVYQGTSDDPFFIYGIGWARGATVWEYSEVSASYRSDVPEGLSFDDNTVVGLGTADDYVYSGTRYSGLETRGELLAELSDVEMYSSSNTDEYSWDHGDFLVGADITRDQGANPGVIWSEVEWTNGEPNRFSEVEILGVVQIDDDVVVHDLSVTAGASVEVLPGASLTVMGELTNNNGVSGVIIMTDANGSGALYNATENVQGTVEVYLSPNQWHFVSSPVTTTQTIEEIFGTPGSHLYGVYEFNESTNEWQPNTENRVPNTGSGYNILYQSTPKNITFVGALNNFRSRRFITLTKGAGGGWNLIGNPFPAPMHWGGKLKKEALEHETIYVTTGGSGSETSWDTFNGVSGVGVPGNDVGNVAIGQGFWVRSGDGGSVGFGCYGKTRDGGTFKIGALDNILPVLGDPDFHRDDRTCSDDVRLQGDPGLRQDDRSTSVVRLELCDDGGRSDQVAICFDSSATEGFDIYDSEKMADNDQNFGIAIPIENKQCIIASYPNFGTNKISIPLTIQPSEGLLSLRMLLGLEQFASIDLEDRFLGIVHNLSIQPVYEFHAGDGFSEGGERFLLHVSFRMHSDDELCSVDRLRLKSRRVLGYYDMVGVFHKNLDGLMAGIYIHVTETNGELCVQKIYYKGY